MPDVYNFDFDRVIYASDWFVDVKSPAEYERDSINYFSGKSALFVRGRNSSSEIKLKQKIFLPTNNHNIKISIYSKGKLDNGYFKAYTGHSCREINLDSTSLLNGKDWNKYELNLKPSPSRILNLELEISGVSAYWIDHLEVKINGSNLGDFNEDHLKFDKDQLPYNKFDDVQYTTIPGIFRNVKSNKVIGIGESLHTSSDFNVWRNDIIKYYIEKRKCRLVLFEVSNDFLRNANQYIQGGGEDPLDLNKGLIGQPYFYTKEFKDLLLWLKEYNSKVENKVNIAGIDIYNDYKTPVFEMLAKMKDSASIKLLNKSFHYDLLFSHVKNEQRLGHYNKYSDILVENLLSSIDLLNKYTKNLVNNSYEFRDSLMFENARELIDNTNSEEEVILSAHLAHLIKGSNAVNFLNLGNRLKRYYKGQYFLLAELVGNGKYFSWGGSYELKHPVLNSLERFLNTINRHDRYFINSEDIDSLFSADFLIRFFGFIPEERQFYPIHNLKDNIDAILFFKNTVPIHMLPLPGEMRAVLNSKAIPAQKKESSPSPIYKISSTSKFINLESGLYKVNTHGIKFEAEGLSPYYIDSSRFFSFKRMKVSPFKSANNNWEIEFSVKSNEISSFKSFLRENNTIAVLIENQIVNILVATNFDSWNKFVMVGRDKSIFQLFSKYLSTKRF
ncbi:hypothetical protein GCM10027051_10190 [Niabella terrae]